MSSQRFIIHFLYFCIFLKFSRQKVQRIPVQTPDSTEELMSFLLYHVSMYLYLLLILICFVLVLAIYTKTLYGQAHIIFISVAFPACFPYNWHLILSAEVIWKKTKNEETRKKNSNRSTFHSWSELNLKDFYHINCTIYIELLGYL